MSRTDSEAGYWLVPDRSRTGTGVESTWSHSWASAPRSGPPEDLATSSTNAVYGTTTLTKDRYA